MEKADPPAYPVAYPPQGYPQQQQQPYPGGAFPYPPGYGGNPGTAPYNPQYQPYPPQQQQQSYPPQQQYATGPGPYQQQQPYMAPGQVMVVSTQPGPVNNHPNRRRNDERFIGLLFGGFLCALCVGTDRAARMGTQALDFVLCTNRGCYCC
eukprot:m.77989 g.77989  ORF g.77989 m.77989 type:complete len:151 (-) comp14725_c0_seq3:658-1110(-)